MKVMVGIIFMGLMLAPAAHAYDLSYVTREAERILASQAVGIKACFELTPNETSISGDGYVVSRNGDTFVVRAREPRGFLYAAWESQRWQAVDGEFVREPYFKERAINFNGSRRSISDWVAATGANVVYLGRKANQRQVDECHALGVEAYAFLYGCDPSKWNLKRYEKYCNEHPSCKAVNPPRSWEKGKMCPCDKYTRLFFQSVISEMAKSVAVDGVVVTFWDDYGLNCQCRKCRECGMNTFSNQVATCIGWFEEALKPLNRKLIVRTWSSGAPHFLREEWVHAPGYGGVGGEPLDLWGGAYDRADKNTVFQTKVYNCDCQPNPPFSRLLGLAKGYHEIAEWQITGQTTGLYYLPASVVEHTAKTIRKVRDMFGDHAGVMMYTGGYRRADYDVLNDEANSINVHAWRQLTWNPDEATEVIWREWAKPRFGLEAPKYIAALKASERASAVVFSPLGLGAPTESIFARTVQRREDLLRYTNRHFLPEGAEALAPTRGNIARVVAEKEIALNELKPLVDALGDSHTNLVARFHQLESHLVVAKALDGALWRYRLLRAMSENGVTDKTLLAEIDDDLLAIRQNSAGLNRALGSPFELIRDIRRCAVEAIERVAGVE